MLGGSRSRGHRRPYSRGMNNMTTMVMVMMMSMMMMVMMVIMMIMIMMMMMSQRKREREGTYMSWRDHVYVLEKQCLSP